MDTWFTFNEWIDGACISDGIRRRERTCDYDQCVSVDSDGIASISNTQDFFDPSCVINYAMVTTGYPWSSSTQKSEVFDLTTEKACQEIPPFPTAIAGSVGETVKGFPIICGGSDESSNCYGLKNYTWTSIGGMLESRSSASSLILANNSIWILGGAGSFQTTELMEIDENGAIIQQSPGPNLPRSSSGHCSVRFEQSKAIVFGGDFGRETFFANLDLGTWADGPQMQEVRYYAACGQITEKETSQQ